MTALAGLTRPAAIAFAILGLTVGLAQAAVLPARVEGWKRVVWVAVTTIGWSIVGWLDWTTNGHRNALAAPEICIALAQGLVLYNRTHRTSWWVVASYVGALLLRSVLPVSVEIVGLAQLPWIVTATAAGLLAGAAYGTVTALAIALLFSERRGQPRRV
ncbi:MAG: hypothetical protein QOF51_3781 [Chloroflexota bacterium]|jgi:hypothetical protein|nr:hypothetical protein [Chloroflexota bacterium]